jgi:large subunit ribosomal protein L18
MKTKNKKLNKKWEKKRKRIKSSLKIGSYPRLVIFRSNKNIFAQIIDDLKSKTIVAASSIDKDLIKDIKASKSKLEKGIVVGKKIGELAKKENVEKVIFDRNGYKFHGRIKALADAVRETGIKF